MFFLPPCTHSSMITLSQSWVAAWQTMAAHPSSAVASLLVLFLHIGPQLAPRGRSVTSTLSWRRLQRGYPQMRS